MKDNSDELVIKTTTRTFRLASGQLLILDDYQIAKIPYLTAIVSSADNFESICNEHGHFKLDPYIQFKHFSFVIESLSFHSVRQMFTHLSKHDDVIEVIALFDFLGIGPQSDPTLDEVDLTFFSNLVYNPLSDAYSQVIKQSDLRDMAVRFGIAMIKEEYDFTNRQVIDQIYWYIMFILSAETFFGPRLRHHMHKIAEYCFSLFSPFLLRNLKRLLWTTIKYARKNIFITNHEDIGPDEENECLWEGSLYDRLSYWFPTFQHSLLSNRTSSDWAYWLSYPSNEEELFRPLNKRIAIYMYEHLQSEICQQAKTEIHNCRRKGLQKRSYESILSRILEHEIVQEEIRKSIWSEIDKLIPRLEKMHIELVKEIQNYEQGWGIWYGYEQGWEIWYGYDPFENVALSFENIQNKALFCELILDKLRQRSFTLEEQICQDIVKILYDIALKQITKWENTEKEIIELQQILSIWRSPEKLFQSVETPIRYKYWTPANRPLSKIQPKHSTR